MTDFERKKIEMELRKFVAGHFVKPPECRNLDQIRFYVSELCNKIDDLEKQCHYVPEWAYTLLAQYNALQNQIVHVEFRNTYC
jgi:hypothetical protein